MGSNTTKLKLLEFTSKEIMSVKSVNSQMKQKKKTKYLKNVDLKSKPQMKKQPPKKGSQIAANKAARISIGNVHKEAEDRKTQQDLRTLYLRFSKELPKSIDEIKELHSDIKFVRTPRTAAKKGDSYSYAFVEFASQEECKEAKNKLSTTQFKGTELYVDFVGEKSKNKKHKDKINAQLNPSRLFVSGLAPGVTESHLKEMFPKSSHALIPKTSRKSNVIFGFVQFSNPADAKAAFDAAKDLTISNHKITVLFAKKTEEKEEVIKKKAEKRKLKQEEKQAKKAKSNEGKIVQSLSENVTEEEKDDDDGKDDEATEKGVNDTDGEDEEDSVDNNDEDDDDDNDDEDDDDDNDDEDGDDNEEGKDESNVAEGDEGNNDEDDDDEEEEDDEDDDDDDEDEDE